MKSVINLLGASRYHRVVFLGWSVEVIDQLGVGEILLLAEEVLLPTGHQRTRDLRLALLHKHNLVVLLHKLILWV